MAAPSKFNPEFHIPWAWSLAIRGATDQEIADEFDVSERTINRWKYVYEKIKIQIVDKHGAPVVDEEGKPVFKEELRPCLDENGDKILSEFGNALQTGKKAADAQVEQALFKRAIGFSAKEEEKIVEVDSNGKVKPVKVRTTERYFPPDTMAGMYWLNNRSRKTGEWSQRQDVTLHSSDEVDLSKLAEEDLRKLASLAPSSSSE